MTIIPSILLAILFITAIAIVVLVLLQNKGGNVGAAFGGGSNTVFGARGAGDFLTKSTSILATVFFLSALGLAAYYNSNSPQQQSDSVISTLNNNADTAANATATEAADDAGAEVPADDSTTPAIPE